jgi:EpsD family peptidyl-prolyl cis-trans isomerase
MPLVASHLTHSFAKPFALILTLAISACSETKTEAPKPSQVIAKVNDAELSVHQLNFTLQGLQETNPEQMAKIRKAALDRLVEQEVLVQDAINKKVDRDPTVRSQLDAAQREILVRNHLQKIGSSVAAPSEELIAKFYLDHPELFKERQLYQFTEVTLPRVPPNWPEIEKALAPTKTMQEVLEELRKKGISLPVAQNIVRAAEDLPQDKLKEFAKLKNGEIIVYAKSPGIMIGQIVARRTVPVDEAKAKPAIIRHLVSKSQGEVVQSQVRRLMDAAKVSYVGEFAKDAKAATPEKAKDAGDATKDTSKDVLEKGLKTLK